jgi:hypothetical protein
VEARIGDWVQGGCLLSLQEAIDEVRSELQSQRAAANLSPTSVRWALEHLSEQGATLSQLLSVAFDFAEPSWLPEVMAVPEASIDFDFHSLAEKLGLDPRTGRPVARSTRSAEPGRLSLVRPAAPTERIAAPELETRLIGDGLRQKPLTGWGGRRGHRQ